MHREGQPNLDSCTYSIFPFQAFTVTLVREELDRQAGVEGSTIRWLYLHHLRFQSYVEEFFRDNTMMSKFLSSPGSAPQSFGRVLIVF